MNVLKLGCLSFLHLVCLFTIYGQNEANNLEKINSMLQQSIELNSIDIERSNLLALSALNESKNNHALLLAAQASFLSGDAQRLLGQVDEALNFTLKSYWVYDLLNHNDGLLKCIGNLSLLYHAKSDFTKALDFAFLVLRKSEVASDTLKIIAAHNSIANIYYSRGSFNEAYNHFKTGKEFAKNLGKEYTNYQFILNQNIANTLLDLGDIERAHQYIDINIRLAHETQDVYFMHIAKIHQGYLFSEKKNFDKAISCFRDALLFAEQIGGANNIASSFMEIGRTYFNWAKVNPNERRNLLRKGVHQLEQASLLFLEIENLNEYKYCQELLAEGYENLGDYKSAYQSFVKFQYIQDSLFNENKTAEIARLSLNHEFSQKQDSIQFAKNQEILLKDLEIEQKSKMNVYLIIALLIFVAFGTILFKQLKTIQLKNAELAESNKIKLRFFNMINHDLRSPVANLLQSLYIQKENPDFIEVLDKNINSVENLYKSMDDLLLWSKGQMEQFQPHFREVCVNDVIQSVVALYPTVEIKMIEKNKKVLVQTDEDYLKAVFRNLISNAIHALRGRKEPRIEISISNLENNVVISISDNGKGANLSEFDNLFSDSMLTRSMGGLGLQMVRDLTQAIGCSVEVNSEINVGTTVTLTLKSE